MSHQPIQKYIAIMVKRMESEQFNDMHDALRLLTYILCKMEFVAIEMLCEQGQLLSNCNIVVMEMPSCNTDIEAYACLQFQRFENFRRINKCASSFHVQSLMQNALDCPKEVVILWLDLQRSQSRAFVGHHSVVNLQSIALQFFDVKDRMQSIALYCESPREGVSCNIFQGTVRDLEILELGPKGLDNFNFRKDQLSIPLFCSCAHKCKCFSGNFTPPCFDLENVQNIAQMVRCCVTHWQETNLRLVDPCLKQQYYFDLPGFIRSLKGCKYSIRVNLYRFSSLPKCTQTSRRLSDFLVIKRTEYDKMEFVAQVKLNAALLCDLFGQSQWKCAYDLPLYFRSLSDGEEYHSLKSQWNVLRTRTEFVVSDKVKFMISVVFDKPFTRSSQGWCFSNIMYDDKTIHVCLENLECTVVGAQHFKGSQNYVREISLLAPDTTIKLDVVAALANIVNEISPMYRINSDAVCDGGKLVLKVNPCILLSDVMLFKDMQEKLGMDAACDLSLMSEEDRLRLQVEFESERTRQELCQQLTKDFGAERSACALDDFSKEVTEYSQVEKHASIQDYALYEKNLFREMRHEEKLSKVLNGPIFQSDFREVPAKSKAQRLQSTNFELIQGKLTLYFCFFFSSSISYLFFVYSRKIDGQSAYQR